MEYRCYDFTQVLFSEFTKIYLITNIDEYEEEIEQEIKIKLGGRRSILLDLNPNETKVILWHGGMEHKYCLKDVVFEKSKKGTLEYDLYKFVVSEGCPPSEASKEEYEYAKDHMFYDSPSVKLYENGAIIKESIGEGKVDFGFIYGKDMMFVEDKSIFHIYSNAVYDGSHVYESEWYKMLENGLREKINISKKEFNLIVSKVCLVDSEMSLYSHFSKNKIIYMRISEEGQSYRQLFYGKTIEEALNKIYDRKSIENECGVALTEENLLKGIEYEYNMRMGYAMGSCRLICINDYDEFENMFDRVGLKKELKKLIYDENDFEQLIKKYNEVY